jgi:hypothetical protein
MFAMVRCGLQLISNDASSVLSTSLDDLHVFLRHAGHEFQLAEQLKYEDKAAVFDVQVQRVVRNHRKQSPGKLLSANVFSHPAAAELMAKCILVPHTYLNEGSMLRCMNSLFRSL